MTDAVDVTQELQTILSDGFIAYYSTVSTQQDVQTLSISATNLIPPTFQALQSINAHGFIQLNASISASQNNQTLNAQGFYYDIGCDISLSQAAQGIVANGFMQTDSIIGMVQQTQYMVSYSINQVVTSQTASRIYNRDWILRKVRNKGTR